MIDYRDSYETKLGTSKQNEKHTMLIASLVRDLFRLRVCGKLPTKQEPGHRAVIVMGHGWHAIYADVLARIFVVSLGVHTMSM